MRVSVHQSHYLPWLRYFDKIDRSDVFVLLDDAQFNRNGYQNRNRVKGPSGPVLLTVPVLHEYQQSLQEVRCNSSVDWQRKHWRTIEQHYRKAPYFERYGPGLHSFYQQSWSRLIDVNEAMLRWFAEQLGIQTRIVCSHALEVEQTATARLISICQKLGATQYLSGAYAINAYLDSRAFETAGVELVTQDWMSPSYTQLYPAFGYIPDLSIVDLMFMHGPDSLNLLRSGAAGQQQEVAHG